MTIYHFICIFSQLTVRPFEQIVRDEVKATIMAQAAAEEREASADRVQAPVVQPNNQWYNQCQ